MARRGCGQRGGQDGSRVSMPPVRSRTMRLGETAGQADERSLRAATYGAAGAAPTVKRCRFASQSRVITSKRPAGPAEYREARRCRAGCDSLAGGAYLPLVISSHRPSERVSQPPACRTRARDQGSTAECRARPVVPMTARPWSQRRSRGNLQWLTARRPTSRWPDPPWPGA